MNCEWVDTQFYFQSLGKIAFNGCQANYKLHIWITGGHQSRPFKVIMILNKWWLAQVGMWLLQGTGVPQRGHSGQKCDRKLLQTAGKYMGTTENIFQCRNSSSFIIQIYSSENRIGRKICNLFLSLSLSLNAPISAIISHCNKIFLKKWKCFQELIYSRCWYSFLSFMPIMLKNWLHLCWSAWISHLM